ncbi:hypothetical protein U1Q18_010079, partial [Sarracenia purpurea var. burkii]
VGLVICSGFWCFGNCSGGLVGTINRCHNAWVVQQPRLRLFLGCFAGLLIALGCDFNTKIKG